MAIGLLITSFLAGILTVIAPCVLPLLPVIIAGSLIDRNRWRPLIVVLSLGISIIVFTFLLKVFTLFINVPPLFWTALSASILILFGFALLFPRAWDWISFKLHFSQESEQWLQRSSNGHSVWSAILLGAALGPVFSSCSPTYFVILATILPVSLWEGLIYLVAYACGLGVILWLIALLGRKLTNQLKFIANPYGWFKKSLGILLLIVGVAIFCGFDKDAELYFITHGAGSTNIERQLLSQVNLNRNKPRITSTLTTATLDWNDDNEGVFGNFGPVPELVGLTGWINSKPLSLHDLRGKVVLIDFWTYSCINCLRTLPYLEKWYQQYASEGLVIIGIQDPEFQFEKNWNNVLKAVRANGLTYPIALDNDHDTWNAYQNQYWPAKYLIDQKGNLRYYHFGEGDYDDTEKLIQSLLHSKNQHLVSTEITAKKSNNPYLTNEIYLGTARKDHQASWGSTLSPGEWSINSAWGQSDSEKITTLSSGAILKLNFYASTANLVLDGQGTAQVIVDGKPLMTHAGRDVKNGILTINGARLYQLTDFGNDDQTHLIEVIFNQPGMNAYSWTFG